MLDTFTPRDLNFRQLETYFYDLLSLSVCIIRAASVVILLYSMVYYCVYFLPLLLYLSITYLSIYLLRFNTFVFSTFYAFLCTLILTLSHMALFLIFYCLCFRSFGPGGMAVINCSSSSLSFNYPVFSHFYLMCY